MKHIEWQEQGYHVLLVEAKFGYYHLLVSRDRQEYAIYDRFQAPSIKAARKRITFNPYFYEVVPPPFPITREAALAGETGIPAYMEPMVRLTENSWPGANIGRN